MNKKNKKSIVGFFIKMLLIFLILDLFMMLISGGLGESTFIYKYGKDLVTEIFYAFVILIVMLLFKNSYVFTDKKEKFWYGVKLAIPIVVVSFIFLASNLISLESFSFLKFINVFIYCVFIGIAEEFLCRGWLQNEFIERYSDNKKEVVISIILSSLVFGVMHIMNLTVQSFFETFLQIVNAMSLGFLLGSVYYKTKNIWSVIFLHSFYDLTLFLGTMNTIKECSYVNPSIMFIIIELISTLFLSASWILGGIYVLNKEDGKKNNLIIVLMVVFIALYFVPIHLLVPNYDKYVVCYDYKSTSEFDEYTISFPSYKKYSIIDENIEFEIYEGKSNTLIIENKNTGFKKSFIIKNMEGFEVFETSDGYELVINTYTDEGTIYYTNYFLKGSMSNDNDYIKKIKFKKFVLPSINNIGYIESNNSRYPYIISTNNDRFVILNDDIFIIK